MKRLPSGEKLLTGARQTMQSWVKVIESFDEIPPAYKDGLLDTLKDIDHFPYMVLAPPVSGSRFQPAERLIFWLDDALYILERKLDQINLLAFPKEEIGMLEVGKVLLYSWFTVTGLTTQGSKHVSTVVYNTSTHRHLQSFFDHIRSLPEKKISSERTEFAPLERLSFKFANFARNSLKGDEKIITSLWQPEISRPIFPFFKKLFSRLLSPAHLTIITELELIFIEDDLHSPQVKGKHYGGIWQYIPLQNLVSVSNIERDGGLFTLIFNIKPDTSVKRTFDTDTTYQALKLKAELEKIIRVYSKI